MGGAHAGVSSTVCKASDDYSGMQRSTLQYWGAACTLWQRLASRVSTRRSTPCHTIQVRNAAWAHLICGVPQPSGSGSRSLCLLPVGFEWSVDLVDLGDSGCVGQRTAQACVDDLAGRGERCEHLVSPGLSCRVDVALVLDRPDSICGQRANHPSTVPNPPYAQS